VLRGLLAETLLLPVHHELCVDAHALALRLLLPTLAGRGRERCAQPQRQPRGLSGPAPALGSPARTGKLLESPAHACSSTSMLCDLGNHAFGRAAAKSTPAC
jgi:hypothetical protein